MVLTMCLPATASAQVWRAGVQLGRVSYGSTPAGAGANASMVVGLNRTGLRDWFGVASALPIQDDPFWAVVSGWKRLETGGRLAPLLDLSAHAFLQHYTVAGSIPLGGGTSTSTRSGQGAGGEALAGVRGSARAMRLELRGGVAAQRSELGDVASSRALPVADARLLLVQSPVTLLAATRGWWHADEQHVFSEGTARVTRGPVFLWGAVGKWLDGGIDDLTWSAGAGAPLGPRVEFQLGARGPTFDPLYLTATESSAFLGVNLRFGGGASLRAPVATPRRDGRIEIRLSARGLHGTPAIAGDFTGWKPEPMQRAGGEWVYRPRLSPGTYHYAFVGPDGVWFVPEAVPGRQPDGMGGYVAVLVVTS